MNKFLIFIFSLILGFIVGHLIESITNKKTDSHCCKCKEKCSEDFNSLDYIVPEGSPNVCSENGFNRNEQIEKIANLLLNISLKNGSKEDIKKAIKHFMVIIDAEKYQLDWKKSEKDNNIEELINKYL